MDWMQYRLGDIVSAVSGQVNPTDPEHKTRPYVGPHNILPNSGRLVDVISAEEARRKSGMYEFDSTHILYCKIGPMQNKVALPDFDGICGSEIYPLIVDEEKITREFLAYSLRQQKFLNYVRKHSNRAVIPKMNRKMLFEYVISVPPIDEQKRITAILDKADEIRDSIQQVQNIRSELVDNIFFDMFGDPIINPNNYKFFKLIDLMSDGFQNGLYISKDRYIDSDGVEMVHMSDAFYDTVRRGCLKQALLEESEITKYNLSSNNLLITRRSLNYEGAAKSCRIPQSNTPLVFESSLIRLTPNEKVVNSTFLHFYINNKRVREAYVYKFVTKSTISGINQKNLSQIPVMLPPIELQNKFMQNIHFLQQIPDSMELSTTNLASINQEMLT